MTSIALKAAPSTPAPITDRAPAPVTDIAQTPAAPGLASVPEILDEIRRGHIVVLVDDEDRENEGDLLFA
ncbi:MAG: 3,4-dihydroxy-2-butanone-4-phosphate synthase, partial [Burkholderiaceae bacterium]|nr:3,4-dihydroxy-2-butanone-4-phosphate synthase [Burkholderiaceae bacterium]